MMLLLATAEHASGRMGLYAMGTRLTSVISNEKGDGPGRSSLWEWQWAAEWPQGLGRGRGVGCHADQQAHNSNALSNYLNLQVTIIAWIGKLDPWTQRGCVII